MLFTVLVRIVIYKLRKISAVRIFKATETTITKTTAITAAANNNSSSNSTKNNNNVHQVICMYQTCGCLIYGMQHNFTRCDGI